MTPELQQYYEELFETFQSTGWSHFIEKTKEVHDMYQTKGWELPVEELSTNKGRMDVLRWILSFQETHEETFRQLEAATEE